MACPDEINDCELQKEGFMAWFWKLLRKDEDGCLKLNVQADVNVEATVEVPVNSDVSMATFLAPDPNGASYIATQYQAWKSANPTKRVIARTFVTGGNGEVALIVEYI